MTPGGGLLEASGALVEAGAALDSGEAERSRSHLRGRDVLGAGELGGVEGAIRVDGQRHPGVEGIGDGPPARMLLVAGDDAGGEELADAARPIAEQSDALAGKILIVIEQRAQSGIERSGVGVAETPVVQSAGGQTRIARAGGSGAVG